MARHFLCRFTLAAIAAGCSFAAAAQTVTYSDSSTLEKLQSHVGVGLEEDGFALHADMTMIGQDGMTRVLPRISSAWSTLDSVDVTTVLKYEDWNRTDEYFSPTIDTTIQYDPTLPFVDSIEGNLRRSSSAANETLKIGLAPVDSDFSLFGGDPFGVDAVLAMGAAEGYRHTSSKITSSIGVGPSISVRSVLQVQDGSAPGVPSQTVDARLVYRAPLSFLQQVEGSVHRSALGDQRQSLALVFPDVARGDPYDSSFRISSKAIVEEILRPNGLEAVSMGVETRLSGFLPPLIGGRNSISLAVERPLDERDARSTSVAYDHSWSSGTASIGLNLKLLRDLEEVEPSMGLTWSTQF